MYALRGLVAGFTVKILVRIPAQVAAGSAGWPVRHGTGVPPRAASPLIIATWLFPAEACGRKMLVLVSSGTAFCASPRRPSKELYRNVLSLVMGKPIAPPNCSRVRLSFTCLPCMLGAAGLTPCLGAR